MRICRTHVATKRNQSIRLYSDNVLLPSWMRLAWLLQQQQLLHCFPYKVFQGCNIGLYEVQIHLQVFMLAPPPLMSLQAIKEAQFVTWSSVRPPATPPLANV